MILVHIAGSLLLIAVVMTSYFLVWYPERGLKNVLSVKRLGILEGTFDKLSQVIVIADHVNAPSDELQRAVEQNLSRGVKYLFLVSHSKAEEELAGYYKIFDALSVIVNQRSGNSTNAHDLVTIQKLPYDWVEVPHIFYQLLATDRCDGVRYVAVRGNQLHEGIADFYTYIEPAYAHMIARAILSDAPSPITVRREEFVGSNVVDFKEAQKKLQSF